MTASRRTSQVVCSIVVALAFVPAAGLRAEDNTNAVISGVSSNHGGADFFVGQTGTNNSLLIQLAGTLTNVNSGVIGNGPAAIGNSATITGSGSVWLYGEDLRVGNFGGSNSLVIADGGRAQGKFGSIGYQPASMGSVGNQALVTGSNSIWANSLDFYVGYYGSSNTLTIMDGGRVEAGRGGVIGGQGGSVGNLAVVQGTGSVWASGSAFYIGFPTGADNNTLLIRNGGAVNNAGNGLLGYSGDSNQVVVEGAGSQWQNAGALYVGDYGDNNSLVISNGGLVQNTSGYVGLNWGSTGNAVQVSGSGSVWTNCGNLYIGYNGQSNRLTITNGARAVSTGVMYLGTRVGSDSNSVLVSGTASAWRGGDLYVGGAGANNQLTIADGGLVENSYGYFGETNSGSNNTALVTGVGSFWSNRYNLAVGYNSVGNSLTIAGGGRVEDNYGYIGQRSSSNMVLVTGDGSFWVNRGLLYVGGGTSNQLLIADGGRVENGEGYIGSGGSNSVLVTGAGSVWINRGDLVVGHYGAGNSLTVTNGGTVFNAASTIGSEIGANNNTVTITGAGSVWHNAGTLTIGLNGSANSLTIRDGGAVDSVAGMFAWVGRTTDATLNSVLVTGSNAVWNVGMAVIGYRGCGNSLTITNGGLVSGNLAIGAEASSNNTVTVSGAGSRLSASSSFVQVGGWGTSNSFTISDGALVTSAGGVIGYGGAGAGTGERNLATVTGTGSRWEMGGAGLNVGLYGSENALVVLDGAYVADGFGGIGLSAGASNNSVLVSGPGSQWLNEGEVWVGSASAGNSVSVSNGAVVSSGHTYVGYFGGMGNSVLVTGSGSLWTNCDNTFIGYSGFKSRMTITDGGQVFDTVGYLGVTSSSSNNTVTVSGTGATWNNGSDLYVGYEGAGNTLWITNGGTVLDQNAFIGTSEASTGNRVRVIGSASQWLNSGTLMIGNSSSGNDLSVRTGGVVSNANAFIGYNPLADRNSVIVQGTGSVWATQNELCIGEYGTSNVLTVIDSGLVKSANGYLGRYAPHNRVWVTGGGLWQNSGTLTVGFGGYDNSLLISNAGQVSATDLSIGGQDTASNNYVVVKCTGSELRVDETLFIGQSGSGNRLAIAEGGSVTCQNASVGANSGASNNSVLVSDAGSSWQIASTISIGNGSSLVISNGGLLRTQMALVGPDTDAGHNTILVDGTNSMWLGNDMNFGELGGANQLTIRNGGVVSNKDVYVANSGGSHNIIAVSGPGSAWLNRYLYLGEDGANNLMVLTAGGVVRSAYASLGDGTHASNNVAVVDGTNSQWQISAQLLLGVAAANNKLVIDNGGAVEVGGDAWVGRSAGSTGNMLWVAGAGSSLSVSGALQVGVASERNLLMITNQATVTAGSITLGQTNSVPPPYTSGASGTLVVASGNWSNSFYSVLTTNGGSSGVITRINPDGSISYEYNRALLIGGPGRLVGTDLLLGGGLTTPPPPMGPTVPNFEPSANLLVVAGASLQTGHLSINGGALFVDPHSRIQVSGNYTQSFNGIVQFSIAGTAPGDYTPIQVDGRAVLDGTLSLVPVGAYTPETNHTQRLIETSGGVTGTFATVQNAIGGVLSPRLDYSDGYNVVLDWMLASFQPYAVSPNQLRMAKALDAAVADPEMAGLLSVLGSVPAENLPGALDQIAPEELASLHQLGFARMESLGNSLLGRVSELRSGSRGFSGQRLSLRDADGPVLAMGDSLASWSGLGDDLFRPTLDNSWGVYLEGLGEFIGVDGDLNAGGYDLTGGGFNLGLDRRLNERLVIGLAAGYAGIESDLDNGGRVDVNRGQGGLYAVWFNNKGAHAEALVGGGFNDYQTRREALGGTARGDTSGSDFTTMLGAGFDQHNGSWSYGPWAVVQYKLVHLDSFTETGSLAPLTILSQNADSLHSQLGAQLSYQATCGTLQFVPNLRVAWRHEYLDRNSPVDAALASGAGGVFSVEGPALGRDSALIGVNLGIQWTPTIGTYLNYSTELGRDNYQPHSVNAGVRVNF